MSKYFLNKNDKLVHGAEICGEHLGDMEMADQIANNKYSARELFTFEFIRDAIMSVFPDSYQLILSDLVKMIAFDAIVGNNDRHFYNWGVIDSTKKSKKMPKFAPIYDSARGLMWNYSDHNIVKIYSNSLNNSKKVVDYIDKACPRISIEDDKLANHFTLIKYLKNEHPDYLAIINNLASEENERKIIRTITKEFFPFFKRISRLHTPGRGSSSSPLLANHR